IFELPYREIQLLSVIKVPRIFVLLYSACFIKGYTVQFFVRIPVLTVAFIVAFTAALVVV
ncbi:MAG: hypothetical protein PHE02_14520, partial [Lachnospiraceae bacterium]|nr:hypothetical protein [Lachnospiraceae bacterium]